MEKAEAYQEKEKEMETKVEDRNAEKPSLEMRDGLKGLRENLKDFLRNETEKRKKSREKTPLLMEEVKEEILQEEETEREPAALPSMVTIVRNQEAMMARQEKMTEELQTLRNLVDQLIYGVRRP
ncbi:hypothetical protein C8P63_103129 [Melghirimyces profundicolus]|uniref:Uncharacterized protein n=2 Tax=Melghirimyces profundicolus TaxID=1242148 RepID=A0A2T6C7P5_9BACL|nr:hypothetical protein C8P63_103129 [Melghirimyces profundicolus]